MKQVLLLALMSLAATNAQASTDFFECSGFGGVEEYVAAIDLKTNNAVYFDNDTTTLMTLKSSRLVEVMVPEIEMIFEGQDNYGGSLKLSFNLTQQMASIKSTDRNGKVYRIRSADCVAAPYRPIGE